MFWFCSDNKLRYRNVCAFVLISISAASSIEVQGVSLSTTNSMVVPGKACRTDYSQRLFREVIRPGWWWRRRLGLNLLLFCLLLFCPLLLLWDLLLLLLVLPLVLPLLLTLLLPLLLTLLLLLHPWVFKFNPVASNHLLISCLPSDILWWLHWDRYTRVTPDRENWNWGERRR